MIVIIDDFVKEDDGDDALFLSHIIEHRDDVFKDPGVYKWWDGWWTSEPRNIFQWLIHYTWVRNCPITKSFEISGIEYWTGIQSTDPKWNDHLVMHTDKDEKLWRETGKVVGPLIGCIYYPPFPKNFDGGNLEIFSDGIDEEPEVVKPKANRLVIFPAGEYFHRVTTVTRGTRYAIAFNLWAGTPTGVESGDLIVE